MSIRVLSSVAAGVIFLALARIASATDAGDVQWQMQKDQAERNAAALTRCMTANGYYDERLSGQCTQAIYGYNPAPPATYSPAPGVTVGQGWVIHPYQPSR
jgi:hypothetical protein